MGKDDFERDESKIPKEDLEKLAKIEKMFSEPVDFNNLPTCSTPDEELREKVQQCANPFSCVLFTAEEATYLGAFEEEALIPADEDEVLTEDELMEIVDYDHVDEPFGII